MDPAYEVHAYTTERGVSPFNRWLEGLKDKRAKAKVLARITRASFGNFGDWKKIAGRTGLREMRDHYGPGYRIYYSIEGQRIILLLAGSNKKDQKKAIAQASERLADYRTRHTNDENQ